jgi:hypothetical protein
MFRVRHFRDWLRAAITGASQAMRTLESPAKPDVRVGDGATTRRIDSASASAQLVFSAHARQNMTRCDRHADVRSFIGNWVDDDAQLCGGADQENLVGVVLGRRAEYEAALKTG